MTPTERLEGPKRIQLRRTKGWRKPEGAVVVSRPSRWGNPYRVRRGPVGWLVSGNGRVSGPVDGEWTKAEAAAFAVESYRDMVHPGRQTNYNIAARIELGGRDLACWCPLDQPCHADVLLQIAAGSVGVSDD